MSYTLDTEGTGLAEADLSQEEVNAQFDQITAGLSNPEHENALHAHVPRQTSGESDSASMEEIEAALANVSSGKADRQPVIALQEPTERINQPAQILTGKALEGASEKELGKRSWVRNKMKEKAAGYMHRSDLRIKNSDWRRGVGINLTAMGAFGNTFTGCSTSQNACKCWGSRDTQRV